MSSRADKSTRQCYKCQRRWPHSSFVKGDAKCEICRDLAKNQIKLHAAKEERKVDGTIPLSEFNDINGAGIYC